jgi:hypothetical protein
MAIKDHKFWAKISAVLMLLTSFFHSLSLFVSTAPTNETERQLLELTTSYKVDAGAGFHPTFSDLFTALSACFSLLCLLGGALLIYFVIKKLDHQIFRGVLNIYLPVFGICFTLMAFFTFLPPIIFTGLIFVSLLVSRFVVPK